MFIYLIYSVSIDHLLHFRHCSLHVCHKSVKERWQTCMTQSLMHGCPFTHPHFSRLFIHLLNYEPDAIVDSWDTVIQPLSSWSLVEGSKPRNYNILWEVLQRCYGSWRKAFSSLLGQVREGWGKEERSLRQEDSRLEDLKVGESIL